MIVLVDKTTVIVHVVNLLLQVLLFGLLRLLMELLRHVSMGCIECFPTVTVFHEQGVSFIIHENPLALF